MTDSRSAPDDLVELVGVAPGRITVIGGGVGGGFAPPETAVDERLRRLRKAVDGLEVGFVLVPTGMDWRKNIDGAIEAYGRLPDELRAAHQLVVTGAMDDRQRAWVEALADDAGVAGRVLAPGHVTDEVLVLLYQTTELVVFPSFYEGFGLPILEARRCGARVLASNASSLPEVLPDERAWFDPWDVAEMAGRMHAALTDDAFAAVLDAVPDPGESWSSTARRLVGVYDSLRPRTRRRPPGRRRLGVVTLLPPAPSGVAEHSARLLDAIARHVDDVEPIAFVPGGSTAAHDYAVHDESALPLAWAEGDLDAVLYCVGNNALHRRVLDLAPFVPGHVLLHDVRLDQLTEAAGPGSVVDRAISVLVQSAHAAALVAAETGAAAIDVGPHPSPEHAPAPVARDARDPRDVVPPWVISAGIAHEAKASDVVAEAFRRIAATGRARTALVGPRGELFVDPDGPVVATGQVARDEYDAWLARAAMAVQLRRTSNGESSGAVAEAIGRGVPLVVSDVGAMAELPDDVAVKLPPDVTVDGLVAAITALLADDDRRSRLADAARRLAARETPAAQAHRIVAAVFDAGSG